MKWYDILACIGFGALLIIMFITIDMRVSASELDEPEAMELSEVLEVSEATSIVQDEQTEPAAGEPIAPEPAAEDMQDAQTEDDTVLIETPALLEEQIQQSSITSDSEVLLFSEETTENTDTEYQLFVACGFGLVLGSFAGLAFVNKWNVGV